MRLFRGLPISVRALTTHRLRSALAVAGIAVGIAGVVLLAAIGAGARGAVLQRIEALGSNLLVVTPTTLDPRAGRARRGETRAQTLRIGDAAAITHGSAAVRRTAPVRDLNVTLKSGRFTAPATLIGTTPAWLPIRDFSLRRGRFFDAAENARRARVAVLGAAIAASLFPDSLDPVGTTLRIDWVPFEVIGVLAPRGMSVAGASSEDDRVFVPVQTALRRLANLDYLSLIYVQAVGGEALDQAGADAAAILRVRHDVPDHGPDDFTLQSQQVVLAAELAAQTSFRRLLLGLGVLSLLVGGVGVLSLMLLAIRERRSEIGLRVAVGARRRDVLVQFLAEALLLAAAGGVLGLALAAGVAEAVSAATRWEARLSPETLLLAGGAVAAIGVGFGVWPAWHAARLDPIAALRGPP